MGIDAAASLGYGFQVSDNIADDLNDDNIRIKKGFDLIFSGAEGCEGSNKIFICIEKSCKSICAYELPKRINLLTVQDDWDQRLKDYATSLGIKKPKIGWWLCASLG